MNQYNTYPFPKAANNIEGVFYITREKNRSRKFSFKKIPLPSLPEQQPLNELIINDNFNQNVNGRVYINNSNYTFLTKDLDLSIQVEDGGYIIGNAYRFPGSPINEDDHNFKWWITIEHVIPAQAIYGTPGMLLFTGDSWSHIHRLLDKEYKGKKLLGWYHTHLFGATDEDGLSIMDKNLHTRFLPLPWQVALLININQYKERELRCYQRTPQGRFLKTPFNILDS